MNSPESLHHAEISVDADGIATISIRNAGSLNILGSAVIADVRAAFERVAALPSLRIVILRGTGDKAFVAGADIKEMARLSTDSAAVFIDGLRQLCEAVRRCPVPVIARLAGWVLGGGLELAAVCDLRVASDCARLGMPEVKVGIPSIIHAALLPRLIGQARTGWLLLTGEHIHADRALAWSLVDTVTPLERLDAEVNALARQLAGYGPHALRQQKRLLSEWMETDLDTAIQRGVGEFASAFATGEPARFMAPFLAKRN
jgi:enoyl-CoA hydratase/carnithine racemase